MEITETLKKGGFTSGTTTVRFTLTCKDGDKPTEIIGYIYQGIDMAGSFNAKPDGTFGISMIPGNGISENDMSSTASQIIATVFEAFNVMEEE